VAGGSHPSYQDLVAEHAELRQIVVDIRAVVGELQAEVAELGQNNRNSSKPPSLDSPFGKPGPKSLRGKSGRKVGGQPGHPGSTLALLDKPDEQLRHEPVTCAGCGADLAEAPEVGMERRGVRRDKPAWRRRWKSSTLKV
jgi:transposase